jgi:transcriptional antiterminator NusG
VNGLPKMAEMENDQFEVMPTSEEEVEELNSTAIEEVVEVSEAVVDTDESNSQVETEQVSHIEVEDQAESDEEDQSDDAEQPSTLVEEEPETTAEEEELVAAEERVDGPDVEEVEEDAEDEVAAESDSEDSGGESEVETDSIVEEEQIEPTIEGEEPSMEAEEDVEAVEASDQSVVEVEGEVEMAPEVEVALPEITEEPEVSEDQEAEPAGEPDDGRHWYVVHCYSGYENKVRHNLEQRIETMGMKAKIFDVVVPTEEEIEVKDGKRRTVERRVFPGYILVQMILSEESWYVVRNTPGVTGFVGMGNEPTPLRPEEVASIVKRMEAEAPRIKVTYSIGQKVRIIDGPFNDFIGTVDDIDMERAKVRVMVSFFGRDTPVELDFLQVEKS